MLSKIEYWLQLLTAFTGMVVILIPLLEFRHREVHTRGRSSGSASRLLCWPVILVQTVTFVAIGIALWHPFPIVITPTRHIIVLVIGSLLYFPAITLYLRGYWTLGRMFGISSGFGATLYQDHKLVQNGPYRYVRHPMYLAVILAAIGALMIFRTWAMVLFAISSLGVVLRAKREESLLADEFEEEWKIYKQRVPGWLPVFRKRVK